MFLKNFENNICLLNYYCIITVAMFIGCLVTDGFIIVVVVVVVVVNVCKLYVAEIKLLCCGKKIKIKRFDTISYN
jgi:hypothetical protein